MENMENMEKGDIETKIIELMNIYIEIISFFECSKCGLCCQRSPNLLFSDEYMNFDKDVIYCKDGLYGLKDPCPFLVKINAKYTILLNQDFVDSHLS